MGLFSEAEIKLDLVRGEKQYLFDRDGLQYLDTMNNALHGTACTPPHQLASWRIHCMMESVLGVH